MSDVRLSQIIAVTGGLGSRATASFSTALKTLERVDLFNGLRKTFEPVQVGEQEVIPPPPEVKLVQKHADDILGTALSDIAEWFDACLTRDHGNTVAKASVVVDGTVLVADAPVPFLLFLGDQLGHVRKVLETLPVLSADKVWTLNPGNNIWESERTFTNSSKTTKVPLVLHPGTDKHPPQVAVTEQEVHQGKKVTQHQSSALPEVRRTALIRRVAVLQDAVKQAVQEANATSVPQKKVGHDLFAWLTAE